MTETRREYGYRRLLVSVPFVEEILHNGTCCAESASLPKDLAIVGVGLSDNGATFELLVKSEAYPEPLPPGDTDLVTGDFHTVECRRARLVDDAGAAAPEPGVKAPTYDVEANNEVMPGCLGYRSNFRRMIAEVLLGYTDELEDGEVLALTIQRVDRTPEEIEALPEL